MPDQFLCVQEGCGKKVTATKNQRYRTHKKPDGEPCEMSSAEIPPRETEAGPVAKDADPGVPEEGRDYATCPQCRRKVPLTRLGYYQPHDQTLRGADRCPLSGVRYSLTKPTVDVPLPGDELPEKGLYVATRPRKSNQAEVEEARASGPRLALPPGSTVSRPKPESAPAGADGPSTASGALSPPTEIDMSGISPADINLARQPMAPSLESTTTSEDSPEWTEVSDWFFLETVHCILMDAVGWQEPPVAAAFDGMLFEERGPTPTGSPQPMGDLEREIATSVKETFYAYSNRKTPDNRSAQTTLGPSEIGTPCDRRLAMSLLGVKPVNPGGDGWAAFVGTCTHVGMGEIYQWADAGTGRYAVEIPLTFGSIVVPRGTSDLLDRRTATVLDWKVMGFSSLKKFKAEGPSETYRVQGQVYGLGALLQGERVKNIAIVGLPRGGFSLDEMHVWSAPFDKKFAQSQLDRVARIAEQVQEIRRPDGLGDTPSQMSTAQVFSTGPKSECTYCPFFLRGDKQMQKGCPGA